MSTPTSTPNSNANNSNNSNSPAILNISDPNDTTFNSVFYDVPLDNLNSDSILHGNSENSGTSLKKKLYYCVLLLLLGGCLSLLIFLSIKINGFVSLARGYSLNISGIGGVEASFSTKEVLNLSAGLSSQLSKMEPQAPSLWNQTYVELE